MREEVLTGEVGQLMGSSLESPLPVPRGVRLYTKFGSDYVYKTKGFLWRRLQRPLGLPASV